MYNISQYIAILRAIPNASPHVVKLLETLIAIEEDFQRKDDREILQRVEPLRDVIAETVQMQQMMDELERGRG